MIAGIVIDAWKLPIFKKYLDEGNWIYTEETLTSAMYILKVTCNLVAELQPTVEAANKECAKTRCPTCED